MGRNGVSWLPNTGPENGMVFEARFSEGLRAAETAPTQRDPHLQCIADHGGVWVHQHACVEGRSLYTPVMCR
jgi:hypothetical protein